MFKAQRAVAPSVPYVTPVIQFGGVPTSRVTARWAFCRVRRPLTQGFRVWPLCEGTPAAGTRDGSACGYGPLGLGPSWTGPLPLGVAQGFRVWPLGAGLGRRLRFDRPIRGGSGFSSFAWRGEGATVYGCLRSRRGEGFAAALGFATELGIAALRWGQSDILDTGQIADSIERRCPLIPAVRHAVYHNFPEKKKKPCDLRCFCWT